MFSTAGFVRILWNAIYLKTIGGVWNEEKNRYTLVGIGGYGNHYVDGLLKRYGSEEWELRESWTRFRKVLAL